MDVIWDLIYVHSSFWDSMTKPFAYIPLFILMLDWKSGCFSKVDEESIDWLLSPSNRFGKVKF